MAEYYDPKDEKFGLISSYLYRYFAEPFLYRYHKLIVSEILNYNPSKILDIGSGTGLLIKELSSKTEAEIYAVEPSKFMIDIAKRRLKKEISSGRVKIYQGSSRNIPIKEKFDLIITTFSFHHWSNKFDSIPYIMNFVANGGLFLIFDYDNDYGKFKNSHGLSTKEFPETIIRGYEVNFKHLPRSILEIILKNPEL
ncbi:MAG: class I SAM-dependent methyltransferase [Thermoplasmatales archaeon]